MTSRKLYYARVYKTIKIFEINLVIHSIGRTNVDKKSYDWQRLSGIILQRDCYVTAKFSKKVYILYTVTLL